MQSHEPGAAADVGAHTLSDRYRKLLEKARRGRRMLRWRKREESSSSAEWLLRRGVRGGCAAISVPLCTSLPLPRAARGPRGRNTTSAACANNKSSRRNGVPAEWPRRFADGSAATRRHATPRDATRRHAAARLSCARREGQSQLTGPPAERASIAARSPQPHLQGT